MYHKGNAAHTGSNAEKYGSYRQHVGFFTMGKLKLQHIRRVLHVAPAMGKPAEWA